MISHRLIPGLCVIGATVLSNESVCETLYGRYSVAIFSNGGREYAHIAVAEADRLTEELGRAWGLPTGERLEIVLCRTHAEFERELGQAQPGWVIGIARAEDNRVFLKQRSLASFGRLVRHEIIHLLLGRALGEANEEAPRWLHEGAAKYYGDDWSGADRTMLAEAYRNGKLHTIDELADFPEHPDQSAVAYAESYVLVKYLVSLDPPHGLATFLAHFRDTREVERAFRRAYGLSTVEIEAGWQREVEAETRSVPLVWAAETLIFLMMVMVFFAAFLRIRKRSREIRLRMEQEELLERLFDETERQTGSRLGKP
ncbi:MAG: peptidase MA family metallohydrolase [Candidatus Zipacnadales bacterium]